MPGGDRSRTLAQCRRGGSQGRVIQRTSPAIATAFGALDRAGIAYRIRKNSWPPEPLAAGAEVDILVRRSALPAIQRALREVGFRHLRSAGHGGHPLYFPFNGPRWVQIHAQTCPPPPLPPLPRPGL